VIRQMEKAIAALRAAPETAGLAAELVAEYERALARASRAGMAILAGLIVVATLLGVFLAVYNDPDAISRVFGGMVTALGMMAIPAAIVIVFAGLVFVEVRNTYVRYRLCVYLDARSGVGPQVAVARHQLEVVPAEVLFKSLHTALTLALVITGFAWAALIWIWAGLGLSFTRSSKGL